MWGRRFVLPCLQDRQLHHRLSLNFLFPVSSKDPANSTGTGCYYKSSHKHELIWRKSKAVLQSNRKGSPGAFSLRSKFLAAWIQDHNT